MAKFSLKLHDPISCIAFIIIMLEWQQKVSFQFYCKLVNGQIFTQTPWPHKLHHFYYHHAKIKVVSFLQSKDTLSHRCDNVKEWASHFWLLLVAQKTALLKSHIKTYRFVIEMHVCKLSLGLEKQKFDKLMPITAQDKESLILTLTGFSSLWHGNTTAVVFLLIGERSWG